eukprot:scaffold8886_cov174-Chaetoceros_neogracile.AAC.1
MHAKDDTDTDATTGATDNYSNRQNSPQIKLADTFNPSSSNYSQNIENDLQNELSAIHSMLKVDLTIGEVAALAKKEELERLAAEVLSKRMEEEERLVERLVTEALAKMDRDSS